MSGPLCKTSSSSPTTFCRSDIQGTDAAQLVAHSAIHVVSVASWPYSLSQNFKSKTLCSICDSFCHTLPNVPKVESSWEQSSFKFATASDWNKLQKSQRPVNYYRCIFLSGTRYIIENIPVIWRNIASPLLAWHYCGFRCKTVKLRHVFAKFLQAGGQSWFGSVSQLDVIQ